MLQTIPLVEAWRTNAGVVRPYSEAAAIAFEECAAAFENAVAEQLEETVGVRAAAEESGYTVVHIRRLIEHGKIPTLEVGGEIRIPRRHLPRKPGHPAVAPGALDGVPREGSVAGRARSRGEIVREALKRDRSVPSKSELLRAALRKKP